MAISSNDKRDAAEAVIINVGRRVAEVRRACGKTQDEFAATLGVASKYLQRIEAGYENLTIATLVNLALCLDVEVAEFFAAASEAPRKTGRPKKTQ